MIRIYEARDSLEAHFLRNLLEAAGVRAEVLGELLGMARGELPMTGDTLPSVWINPEDAKTAMAVIDDFEQKQKEREEFSD